MKYLVYKISGGLCHMLIQINNLIYLSKELNRFLIIDCLGGAFQNDFNKYFSIPDFKYVTNYDCLYEDNSLNKELFEPYVNANVINSENGYVLNGKLIDSTINSMKENNDEIIYCSCTENIRNIPWQIKANKNIVDKISTHKINGKYIGVHFRNTDAKNTLESFIPKIMEYSKQINTIYLGTDDYAAFDRLNKLLENKFKIIQYTKPFNAGGKNIHYSNPNKDEVIMNALIDMYHLIYSTHFVPSLNSSFSRKIIEFKREGDNFFN
jgi:hypothetical protein